MNAVSNEIRPTSIAFYIRPTGTQISLLGTEMSADKYPSIISSQRATIVYIFTKFQNCARCEKHLKDKDNNLHLERKCARIFALGHYLFLVPHSCRSWKTVRFSEQIMSADIFAPSDDCLYIPQFSKLRVLRKIFETQ